MFVRVIAMGFSIDGDLLRWLVFRIGLSYGKVGSLCVLAVHVGCERGRRFLAPSLNYRGRRSCIPR